jgi:hypothetical protein
MAGCWTAGCGAAGCCPHADVTRIIARIKLQIPLDNVCFAFKYFLLASDYLIS